MQSTILPKYVGDVKGRLRDGHGTYTFPYAGFEYEGEWVQGVKHGRGKLTLPDASVYEGDFVEGEMIGRGTRTWGEGSGRNGAQYRGDFLRGEFHGVGTYTAADGTVYEGQFVQRQRHGKGTIRTPGGDVFEGEWRGNKRNGEGTEVYGNGGKYTGQWAEDRKHGAGNQVEANGTTYDGQWSEGVRVGEGKAVCGLTGIEFGGEWVADEAQGVSGGFQVTLGEVGKGGVVPTDPLPEVQVQCTTQTLHEEGSTKDVDAESFRTLAMEVHSAEAYKANPATSQALPVWVERCGVEQVAYGTGPWSVEEVCPEEWRDTYGRTPLPPNPVFAFARASSSGTDGFTAAAVPLAVETEMPLMVEAGIPKKAGATHTYVVDFALRPRAQSTTELGRDEEERKEGGEEKQKGDEAPAPRVVLEYGGLLRVDESPEQALTVSVLGGEPVELAAAPVADAAPAAGEGGMGMHRLTLTVHLGSNLLVVVVLDGDAENMKVGVPVTDAAAASAAMAAPGELSVGEEGVELWTLAAFEGVLDESTASVFRRWRAVEAAAAAVEARERSQWEKEHPPPTDEEVEAAQAAPKGGRGKQKQSTEPEPGEEPPETVEGSSKSTTLRTQTRAGKAVFGAARVPRDAEAMEYVVVVRDASFEGAVKTGKEGGGWTFVRPLATVVEGFEVGAARGGGTGNGKQKK